MAQLSVRENGSVRHSEELGDIFKDWKGSEEHWLFVAPHDDDIVLGGGLIMQKAQEAGVKLSMLITTNGQMGYCTPDQKSNIADVREAETRESFELYDGIDDIEFLGFPDGSLNVYSGARFYSEGDPVNVEGLSGMQPAYTRSLRRTRPTRVFVPGGSDYHPDHKLTYQELLISVFHASGNIWPELGEALPAVPHVYEMAIYCDFAGDPDIKIESSVEALEKKVKSIEVYRSQPQIASLIESVRRSGPVEYLRDLTFEFYRPSKYKSLFE